MLSNQNRTHENHLRREFSAEKLGDNRKQEQPVKILRVVTASELCLAEPTRKSYEGKDKQV